MSLKVYEYRKCSTCRNALKYLEARGISYTAVPIRDTPPSMSELKTMLNVYNGDIKKLFNRSGGDYREMNLKDKLGAMSDDAALKLMRSNGNLVKRPFAIDGAKGIVGFNEAEWNNLF
jgi:arsenate reductase (glutaredoxin)